MLGTNDLLQGNSAESVSERMETFISGIRLDTSQILLIAPMPMQKGEWVPSQELIDKSEKLVIMYKNLAERLRTNFADAGEWNAPLAFDGVHLTQEGHRAFSEGLAEYLKKENLLCFRSV